MKTGWRLTSRVVLPPTEGGSELNSSLPDGRVFTALLEQIEGTTLVQLCGQLDMAGIPNVKAAFDQALGFGPVVVDLRSLTFIDSMGLEALLSAAKTRVDEGKSPLLFIRGPEQVQRVFEINHVDSFLEWVELP
jgi:anti-sigma B factor antagonist